MALITLIPGEKFAHCHKDSNKSTCIKGKVKIEYSGQEKVLYQGDSVEVPNGVLHTLTNIGSSDSIIACAHQPVPPEAV